ncbi:MAG TPA: 30S ribosomal protein S6 [Polyangiaceae bacterium]|jgi:small subunit ribosomal protein S6|nr:30S ribosomal protein S6 [Polyangiaceae bacterium]
MAEAQATNLGAAAREYETIYVLRPDAGREASEGISSRVLDVISKQRGALTRVENWGYRKLAYPVKKHGRGVYVYLKYVGDGALVAELERNLRIQDAVLKFQTVKISDEVASTSAEPGQIEFEHLDVIEDADPEDSLAKTLGLEDVRDDFRASASEDSEGDLEEAEESEGGEESEEAQ